VIVDQSVYADYLDVLAPKVEALTTGNPMKEAVTVGPMVREGDAERVESWISEAAAAGARVITGGARDGAIVQPAILADVDRDMRFSRQELFGPAVGVTPVSGINEAIEYANDTRYGLSAAIFTENIDNALKFALEVESGNLNINGGTQFRADLMPYGGLKDSGMGKEGPRYAVEEMTELKMVIIHRS
jgi:acyl-CoA reductase-like NAD-dependent aldehyde dehydrogenase